MMLWLQYDAAPAHFTLNVCDILNRQFLCCWIDHGSPASSAALSWPPHNPDLAYLRDYQGISICTLLLQKWFVHISGTGIHPSHATFLHEIRCYQIHQRNRTVKWAANILAHNITCGGLCSNFTVKWKILVSAEQHFCDGSCNKLYTYQWREPLSRMR